MADALLAGAAGLVAGGVGGVAWGVRVVTGRRSKPPAAGDGGHTTPAHPAVDPGDLAVATDGPLGGATPLASRSPEILAHASVAALRAGLIVLDAADRPVLANPAARRMELVRPGIGGSGDIVTHTVLRTLAGQVRRSGERRDAELDLPASEGRARLPLGVRVSVVALGAGHVAIEVEDVTEAHRVARVRRDFVDNVSHELKTPVGALQLLSEALLDAIDTEPESGAVDGVAARRFAERIQHESKRMGRLVSELLELSRLQGAEPLPQPEPVTVSRILAEVLDRTRTTASAKDIAIEIHASREMTVYGNESQLVMAVANLIDNAVAYSPERTRVTVTATRGDGTVDLAVTDEGMGIGATDLDRIFERFYRADPARSRATGGTGLGLAIVKHIATNHGGRVTVASAPGAGSTFTLRLPASPPQAMASARTPDGLHPSEPARRDRDPATPANTSEAATPANQ